MTLANSTLLKKRFSPYSFKRNIIPFPEKRTERIKPPDSDCEAIDTSHMFKTGEKTVEELQREYMDSYKKAERMLVINFYTGGGIYRRGILDSIYRGVNPLAR